MPSGQTRERSRRDTRARAANKAKKAVGERTFVIEPFHAIVGDRNGRRALRHRDFEEVQRVDARGSGGVDALREALEREKRAHAKIKAELEELESHYASDLEIRAMKTKKLRLKDAVAALERDVRRAESSEALGAGSYGKVWKARDSKTGAEVAVKIEPVDDSANGVASALGREFELMRRVKASDPRCFPAPLFFGEQSVMGKRSRVLVMDLLGSSLEDISQSVMLGTGFTRVTTARIAKRLFTALEAMQRVGVVHGDIKPDNLCTEVQANDGKKRNGILLVDFGEAVIFDDPSYSARIHEEVPRHLWRGTWLFSSANVDGGSALAPRDDLESAIFTLAYLRTGRLPWTHVIDDFGDTELDVRVLAPIKRAVDSGAALLSPRGAEAPAPECDDADVVFFHRVLTHARGLAIEDLPDYQFLQRCVQDWRDALDAPYDWQRR